MDILERWKATFNHAEPDYVSSFVQAIMTKKQMEIDDVYGDDFTEEDLCITPLGDYTMKKWAGFESSWGFSVPFRTFHPNIRRTRYLVKKGSEWVHVDSLPGGVTRFRMEQWDGKISENMGDGRDINFYIDGNLYAGPGGAIDQDGWDPKATMDLWSERYGERCAELYEDARYESVEREYHETVQKNQFIPIFGLPGFAESVRESFGIRAFSVFARKYPHVVEHAVKMHEPVAITAAQAAAKAHAPFCIIADDIAYKHNVFCSPKQYRRFFAPLFKKMADIVHSGGGKIFFHTDGYSEPYWDTWINYCGFDGQESLEPAAWYFPEGYEDKPIHKDGPTKPDLVKPGKVIRYLKETYGDRFVLLGNMDMSTVMPLASPEEVAWVTRDIIESGAPGGGFVFACCTDITDATPLENVIAMREAYRKYRHCY
ncbi:MAG: uroporphyrinogen decarboxylase family protein [Promethearchaeota archaeon]